MVYKTTDDSFEKDVLECDIPVVVDFWAPWCGPCMVIAPTTEKLSEEYEGKVKFYKLNVDENPRIAKKYQIMSIPLLLFFNNGGVVDESLGAVPEIMVRTKVESLV